MDLNTADIEVSDVKVSAAPKKGRSLFLFLLVVIAVVALAVVVVPLAKNYLQKPAVKPVVPVKQTVSNADQKKLAMEKIVKASFLSSKDKNIISFINLASTEKDPAKKYTDYVKAYSLMITSYNSNTKESKADRLNQKMALMLVQEYASGLKGYKAGDFVIPK